MNILFPKDRDFEIFKKEAAKTIPNYKMSVLFKIYYLVQSVNFKAIKECSNPKIHHEILLSISTRYHHYLKFLSDQGIIEIGTYYKVGKESKSYLFTHFYPPNLKVLTIKVVKVNPFYFHSTSIIQVYNPLLSSNSTLNFEDFSLKAKSQNKFSPSRCFEPLNNNLDFLYKVNDFLPFLTFDEELATELNEKNLLELQKNPETKLVQKGKDRFGRKLYEEINKEALHSYNYNLKLIADWKSKDFSQLKVDNTSYRFHNPITNLSKILRPAFSLNGENLISLDLSCSQPFLSLLIMKPEFWYSGKLSDENKSRYHKIFGTPKKEALINIDTVGMLPYFDAPIYSCILKELKKIGNNFSNRCLSSDLYNFMMNEMKDKTGKELSREYMKHAVLMAMYSSNSTQNEAKKLFAKLFPEESKFFSIIKKGRDEFIGYNGKTYTQYSVLPILMQRVESTIFIHHIAREIITKHPNILMIPLHDSIITTASNAELVKEIIERNIVELTGFTTKIKPEHWI